MTRNAGADRELMDRAWEAMWGLPEVSTLDLPRDLPEGLTDIAVQVWRAYKALPSKYTMTHPPDSDVQVSPREAVRRAAVRERARQAAIDRERGFLTARQILRESYPDFDVVERNQDRLMVDTHIEPVFDDGSEDDLIFDEEDPRQLIAGLSVLVDLHGDDGVSPIERAYYASLDGGDLIALSRAVFRLYKELPAEKHLRWKSRPIAEGASPTMVATHLNQETRRRVRIRAIERSWIIARGHLGDLDELRRLLAERHAKTES